MKTKTLIAAMLLAAVVAGADTITPRQRIVLASNAPVVLTATATNDLNSALQRGLFEEEGNRDYAAAIANYQSLVAQFDQHHQLAATAIFRLGECYRKLGKTNEAVAQYERIVREFSDQQTLATLSRQNIAGLGSAAQTSAASANETLLASDDEEKEIRRIQTMIQNSPDLINSTAHGVTPLMQAASSGQIRVVGFLLAHGANINLKSGGEAPLHGATKSGNKAMVELLLNRGADVNATDGTGGTALHIAVEQAFRSIAEVLVAHQADVNARNAPMNNEATPLHRAAALGHVEMIKFLIAHGAEVNTRANNSSTPLSSAVGSAQLDAVKALLGAKANPDLYGNDGQTSLSDAASRGYLEMVKTLLDAKADPNGGERNPPLFYAIKQGNTNLAALLIRAGAEVDRARALDGQMTSDSPRRRPSGDQIFTNTPLAFAVVQNQAAMVEMLLKFKADPNGDDGSGEPLIFKGLFHPDIMKTLLEAGADPNSIKTGPNGIGYQGETPLLLAARIHFQPSQDGKSYYAISEADLGAARLLIAHGANANARRPSDGATVLHLAAETGNRELVELILANKVDLNARNNAGETPLDLVKGSKRPPAAPERAVSYQVIAGLLRARGALDDLPKMDRIQVSRPAANFSATVFQKGTNDWNRFTLLETILRVYQGNPMQSPLTDPSFPDLTRLTVVRRQPGTTNATRLEISLPNSSDEIDCARNIALEFGDVVEIPERLHALGERVVGLTDSQRQGLINCLNGKVRLIASGKSTELAIQPFAIRSLIGSVLSGVDARNVLLSSSDNSRVKVTRRDPVTGKQQEWILDCSNPNNTPDLWLRGGDVIEVPDK